LFFAVLFFILYNRKKVIREKARRISYEEQTERNTISRTKSVAESERRKEGA
jgi:hypothetical protein